MPRVPNLPQAAKSPLSDEKPSPTNLLMAAAEMNRMGRLTEPDDKSAKPSLRTNPKAQVLRQR